MPELVVPVQTRRLSLREYVPGDLPAVKAIVSAPAYWLHQPSDAPTDRQIEALVNWAVQEQSLTPRTNYYLAAARQADGALIGEAVLRITAPGQAEIGFGIAEAARGQGYAVEVCEALLGAAFGHFGLHRVLAQTTPENAAAIHVLEKAGFVREGLLRETIRARGRWWSMVVHAMLEQDYAARRR